MVIGAGLSLSAGKSRGGVVGRTTRMESPQGASRTVDVIA